MLAVAHAQREPAEAAQHLERAIALNPENRGLAKSDPDLERCAATRRSGRRSTRRPLRDPTAAAPPFSRSR
jgi:hypothetical protein